MLSFIDWVGRAGLADRPWLVLGKGPTFATRHSFDLSLYATLGLNHVCAAQPVDVAHLVDLDVVEQAGDALEANAGMVVLPWFPHVRTEGGALGRKPATRPSPRPLDELIVDVPALSRLARAGRLLWYNASTARTVRPGSPVIRTEYFSAVPALDLLAASGVRVVRSLGVDGGDRYSPEFRALEGSTLLTGRWKAFDPQFTAIAQIRLARAVSFAPLDVDAPARVYVGATAAQDLPHKVLAFSIDRHASLDVSVSSLGDTAVVIPTPRHLRNRPRSPFSFQRFVVPEAAGFRGRALYLDSDMLVFGDVRQLWREPFGDAEVVTVAAEPHADRGTQFSVMLLDCERLRWKIADLVAGLDAGAMTYEQLVYDLAPAARVRASLPAGWNRLDSYDDDTSLLHYTRMTTQPWVYREHPLGYLWCRSLLEAIAHRRITRADVAAAVERGHVRPSLLYQVDHGVEDPLALPGEARRLDSSFAPALPHDSWRERLARPGQLARAAWRRAGRAIGIDRAAATMRERRRWAK